MKPRQNFQQRNNVPYSRLHKSGFSVYSGKLPYKRNIMETRSKQTRKSSKNAPQKQVHEEVQTSYRTSRAVPSVVKKQPNESKARLEARINASVLAQIKRAAEIQGRSITDFVVNAALAAATKAIEDNHIVQLSLEGQTAFADALLNPPEPNAALRRAFERHDQLVVKNS
jgi:uncharacterized protein (DUF1778 family)